MSAGVREQGSTARCGRCWAALSSTSSAPGSRAKTDFVSALGHELRTPLQAITGFTELLGALDLDGERGATALSHIAEAAGHVLTMVNEVLDVARIEARALPITLNDVALQPVVAGVLAMVNRWPLPSGSPCIRRPRPRACTYAPTSGESGKGCSSW